MAIFKRGKARDFWAKIKEALWPSMGWGRTVAYYRHRVFRTGDSNYKITAGLASGAAISFTPLLGTHFFQSIFLAWLVRGSMLAGFIGTALGNPWTFPFIFWIDYEIGTWVCDFFGAEHFIALPADLDFSVSPWELLSYLLHHPIKLLLPLIVGGYIAALLCWPIAYALLYYPVRMMRTAYHSQKQRLAQRKIFKKKDVP